VDVKFKIFRFDPQRDKAPRYDRFTVDASPNNRILDCLNTIRWEQDGSLAYRMSCGHGVCGSDGMTINGVAALACQKLVKDYDHIKDIVIEPLPFFPVVKDLVVDLTSFFQRMKAIHPARDEDVPDVEAGEERKQSIDERALFAEAIKCIMCACCTASCPVVLHEEPEFIGPATVLRAQRYLFDSRVTDVLDRMKIMETPHGVWRCKTYFKCTEVCPKSIKVTEAILQTKRKIRSELHPRGT